MSMSLTTITPAVNNSRGVPRGLSYFLSDDDKNKLFQSNRDKNNGSPMGILPFLSKNDVIKINARKSFSLVEKFCYDFYLLSATFADFPKRGLLNLVQLEDGNFAKVSEILKYRGWKCHTGCYKYLQNKYNPLFTTTYYYGTHFDKNKLEGSPIGSYCTITTSNLDTPFNLLYVGQKGTIKQIGLSKPLVSNHVINKLKLKTPVNRDFYLPFATLFPFDIRL